MAKDEKKAALDAALKKIEKNFGKGAVMRMGEKADTQISTVPTGSLALDAAIGVGGYPRGRIIEVYGPESSGKTTVALHAVAEVQKRGGTAAYIDAENAMDPAYAEALGVDIDSLILSQPNTGEEGLQIADTLISSGAIDIVVVDHQRLLPFDFSGRRRLACRRASTARAPQTRSPIPSAITASGQSTGRFHSRIFASRRSASTS